MSVVSLPGVIRPPRPDIDTYFMSMAVLASSRASCARRKVGCVLINARHHVLATGYNGPATGMANCSEHPCAGASMPSGEGLHLCEAIHAEQNALLQCKDVWQIDTAYITASSCITCTKLLLNTSCQTIVFLEEYPHSDAKDLWIRSGRKWEQYTRPEQLLIRNV